MIVPEEIKSQLTCSICHEVYFNAVTLLCQHSFCKSCIKKMTEKKCPICRAHFFIPKEYNRILDETCRWLYAEEYSDKLNDNKKQKLLAAETEKMREEFRNQLHDNIVTTEITDHTNEQITTIINEANKFIITLMRPRNMLNLFSKLNLLFLASYIWYIGIDVISLPFDLNNLLKQISAFGIIMIHLSILMGLHALYLYQSAREQLRSNEFQDITAHIVRHVLRPQLLQ